MGLRYSASGSLKRYVRFRKSLSFRLNSLKVLIAQSVILIYSFVDPERIVITLMFCFTMFKIGDENNFM